MQRSPNSAAERSTPHTCRLGSVPHDDPLAQSWVVQTRRVAQVHHRILGEVLAGTPSPDSTQEVLEAACEYLSEVLSTFDMAHRVLHDPAAEPPSPDDRRYG